MMDLVSVSENEEPQVQAAPAPAKPTGLPEHAVLNDDGTITLTLQWPEALHEEAVGERLVFTRLRGADMRAMMNSEEKDGSLLLFYRSILAGDLHGPRIFDALDAIDAKAALKIVGFLTGARHKTSGLPEHAVLDDDGTITLTLQWPAALRTKDAQGNVNEEPVGEQLVFNRLRGADMRAMMNSDDKNGSLLLFYRSIRAGDARGPRIFDALDAIDAKAALDIVSFLTGAGRETGG